MRLKMELTEQLDYKAAVSLHYVLSSRLCDVEFFFLLSEQIKGFKKIQQSFKSVQTVLGLELCNCEHKADATVNSPNSYLLTFTASVFSRRLYPK